MAAGQREQWRVLFLAYLLVCPEPAIAYDSLHMVDLQQVICQPSEGGLGYFDVELSTIELSAAEYSPHVVTFLRTSNQTTIIAFTLMNQDGKEWAPGLQSVELSYVASRRLGADVGEGLEQVAEDAPSQAEDELEEEAGEERRLAARRRSSSTPSRRRAPSPPRRRSSPPRRRASPPRRRSTPRRRSAPVSTAPRRRSTAYVPPGTASTYPSRYSSTGTGNVGYGYTSQGAMTSNYGGGYPASSSYGYSGTSSYGAPGAYGRSSAGMALGAGLVGGAVVGAGSYYLYNRLRRSTCAGYQCCYGCDSSCYGRTGCGSTCNTCQVSMNRQYYRDDILQDTGFYPSDMKPYPLKLRIMSVVGAGYSSTAICPPVGWALVNCSVAPESDDLFVTLTSLDELSDPSVGTASGARRPGSASRCPAALAGVLAACAMVPGAVGGA